MDHRILYFCEIAAFFRLKRKLICVVFCASFLAILTGVWLWKEPLYKAEGTFCQGEGAQDLSSMQAILSTIQRAPQKTSASGILRSNRLLSRAAERVGLQADWPGLRAVFFTGDVPRHVTLEPIDATHYRIVGYGMGQLHKPFAVRDLRFTLVDMPKKPCHLTLTPMRQLLSKMHKRLKIRAHRTDPALLHIQFKHSCRRSAISFIDVLMAEYQIYLTQEHERIALAQIDFLQKRQTQLLGKFQEALDRHVTYLEHGVDADGYLGLCQEVDMLNQPKESYTAKRHQLDLDIKKWYTPQWEARAYHPWVEGIERKEALAFEEDRFADNSLPLEEYAEIDLELAQSLLNRYADTREGIFSKIGIIDGILKRIDEKTFDIQGLGEVLTDPVSQSLVDRAAKLAMVMTDRDSYAYRERQAAQAALHTQKAGLKGHLSKQRAVLQERLAQIERKLAGLRAAVLTLIRKEKASVEGKLREIGDQFGKIPVKWRKETELKMEKDLTMQIMEGLSQIVESKIIHHHLFHIESGPLDAADAPLKPQSRRPFTCATIGGGCAAFLTFLFLLIREVQHGLPVSRPFLLDRGYSLIERPASLLSRLTLSIQEGEVVALIDWDHPDQLRYALNARGICVTITACPLAPALWQKPPGCVLISCKGEQEALIATAIADRFVVDAVGKRPEDLTVFPKAASDFIL